MALAKISLYDILKQLTLAESGSLHSHELDRFVLLPAVLVQEKFVIYIVPRMFISIFLSSF